MANVWIIKPLAIATFSPSSTGAGSAANIANDYAGVIWRSASATVHTMTMDLGADTAFDTILLFGVDGGLIDTGTAIVDLATTAQGSSYSGPLTSSGTGVGNHWAGPSVPILASGPRPLSGKGISLFDISSGPPASNRYARLIFSFASAATIEISRIVIGKRFTPQRNFSFGGGPGVKDLGTLDFSARAVLMRRRAKKLRTLSMSFTSLHKDEVIASVRPLLEYMGNTEMIAVCTDPTADADRQNRCYFGPHVGDLGLTLRKADCWETKLNLVSIF